MRKHCNQYRCKHGKDVGAYMISFLYLMIILVGLHDYHIFTKLQANASSDIISPVSTTLIPVSPSILHATESAELINETDTQEEIEKYIRTIFGRDAKTAIAVSRNECGPTNKYYPSCQFKTAHENSIGLFQINLKSEYAKVHYDRVPGETLDDKIEWLKDPHNNVLMAYWIYSHSGWFPWTAFTSGNYLKDM